MTSKVFSLHRVSPTNTGDIASSPTLWVPKLAGADHVDVLDGDLRRVREVAEEQPVTVVVGGGGLFGNHWFDRILSDLSDAAAALPNLEVAIWGAGFNTHYDQPFVETPAGLFEQAAAVALRDRGVNYDWAPCASVLHPAFESSYEPEHPVVAFTHQRSHVLHEFAEAAGIPVRENRGPDVADAIRFIASGETVITDTYHGAYWATLLGRRVSVSTTFSTKFDNLPWPVPVSRTIDLKKAITSAWAFPDALAEALLATNEMTKRVLEVVRR
jgi:hypothetical protein